MKAEIYWVKTDLAGRLAVMPRPRGGDWLEDELASLRRDGVHVLVSLLTAEEVQELDLAQEPELCRRDGMAYRSFPIPDRDAPDHVPALVDELAERVMKGDAVAIHCRQGIGRSAAIAAAVLVRAGLPLDDALARLTAARGVPVPETEEQKKWLARHFMRRSEQDF